MHRRPFEGRHLVSNLLATFLKMKVALGLCMQGGGGIYDDQHAF